MKLVEKSYADASIIEIKDDASNTLVSVNFMSLNVGDTKYKWEMAVHFGIADSNDTYIHIVDNGTIYQPNFRKYMSGYIQGLIKFVSKFNPRKVTSWDNGQRQMCDKLLELRNDLLNNDKKLFNITKISSSRTVGATVETKEYLITEIE